MCGVAGDSRNSVSGGDLCPHFPERDARWQPFPAGPAWSQPPRALAPGEMQGSKEGATSAHTCVRTLRPWGWKVNLEGVPAHVGRTGRAGRPRRREEEKRSSSGIALWD